MKSLLSSRPTVLQMELRGLWIALIAHDQENPLMSYMGKLPCIGQMLERLINVFWRGRWPENPDLLYFGQVSQFFLSWLLYPNLFLGNPLEYSCLEYPMDKGTWWATVHRVAKSWAWCNPSRPPGGSDVWVGILSQARHMDTGERVPCRENGKCQGPQAETSLNKPLDVWGRKWDGEGIVKKRFQWHDSEVSQED